MRLAGLFLMGLALAGCRADDADGDGYTADVDCNDADATIHPEAVERCDARDNNCDGAVDEEDGASERVWYADSDGDGFGNEAAPSYGCVAPQGSTADHSDCDDASPAIHPGAFEPGCADPVDYNCDGQVQVAEGEELPYDGVDNDCDPFTPDDDLDGDGYGLTQDCDDTNLFIGPDAAEVPYDGVDNDCDPLTLDDDLDSDGFLRADDCDDAQAEVHPDAPELPYDGVDNDCDPLTLDDDLDSDGIAGALDCDDANPKVSPLAHELPYDSVDNDCDPLTPDDDLDGDGFLHALDCDDRSAAISPAATERPYDGVDNDCDPLTPDDDLDGDGFPQALDCDDGDATLSPAAAELPYDGVDNDCDPLTPDDDLDSDGFPRALDCDDGDAAVSPLAHELPYDGVDNDCDPLTPDDDLDGDGDTVAAGDCDDSDPTVGPSQPERYYDGIDANCDGLSDYDLDGDGYDTWLFGRHGGDCDDRDPNAGLCDGSAPEAAAPTCLAVLAQDPTRPSGPYWLDPPGNTMGAYEAWCDLQTDGGGYTMLKLDLGTPVGAPEATAACGQYGLDLVVPRGPAHLQSLYQVATDTGFGPSAAPEYLYLLGVYPRFDRATCSAMPLTSENPLCGWNTNDGTPFFVHWRWDITEPNGDNTLTGSQYYAWAVDPITGRVSNAGHNDIRPGYTSATVMCQLSDKLGPDPTDLPTSCLDLLQQAPWTLSGPYTIDPADELTGPVTTWCDMDTDGGGWTLVGKGREGWQWDDWGQGDLANLADRSSPEVVTLPAWTVQALLGGGWNGPRAAVDGLRLDREEMGQSARWTALAFPLFDWSFDQGWGLHYELLGVGGADGTTADVQISGDDYSRIFTFADPLLDGTMGFAAGCCGPEDTDLDGLPDVEDGWTFNGQAHAIPMTTLWVRE